MPAIDVLGSVKVSRLEKGVGCDGRAGSSGRCGRFGTLLWGSAEWVVV